MKQVFLSAALLFIFTGAHAAQISANLPYDDKDFACTSTADADRYIGDFGIDVQSFGGKELCNAQVDTKKLLNDLQIIEKANFQANGNHSFIKGYVERDRYYSWMKNETRGMDRGNDIPFATAYNSGGYFTMQDGWAKLSTLGRVGTVIHEARHTAGYRHYGCTHGPYKNSSVSGCDTSYAQGGSHAVEMEYYARVVIESTNLSPVYKAMARLMALGRSNHVFNQSPVVKREAITLASATDMFLLDKGELIKRELPRMELNWTLKRTSFGASFYAARKAYAVDMYSNLMNGVNLQDDYSYFKLLYIDRTNMPAQIADIEEYDANEYRYFVAMDPNGRLSSYNYPQGQWFAASAPTAGAVRLTQMAPNGQQGLFVIRNDGSILPYNGSNRTLGAALPVKWDAQVVNYAKDNSVLLQLGKDGKVVDASSKALIPALQDYSFNNMTNVPMYDAFEVIK